MNIHIHTQYAENYGDATNPYWKMKGGSTYVLPFPHALNDRIGPDAAAAVEAVRPKIENRDDFSETYVLDWELTSEALTHDEKLQQEYDGKISFPSPRLTLP